MSLEVRSAAEIEPEVLAAFLRQSFAPAKAAFLLRHGTWKHRGQDWQLALVDDEKVIGYCGVIPVRCRVGEETRDAVWWVDLVIDPAYRGRGLQTLFDDRVRAMTQLKLGFPNALAAAIHRQHSWGVREDYETLLMPLRPRQLRSLRSATGQRRLVLRVGARLMEPSAALLRRRLRSDARRQIDRSSDIDAASLADVFERFHPVQQTTIARNRDYLDWRYGRSPNRAQLTVYRAENRLAAVVRTLPGPDRPVVRVLDVFGALDRHALVVDLLKAVGHDAVSAGAAQATLFSTLPAIGRAARLAGFQVRSDGRFCWYSDDRSVHQAIANSVHHWVLGDSDHDEPV